MARHMNPGDTLTVRYWPAHKPPPSGWRDVVPMGGHHWRGKIIAKDRDTWKSSSPWRFSLRLLQRIRRAARAASASRR